MFAAEIRERRIHHRSFSRWRWHLDEVFVRINGETHYLWRAVDHEGEVLEVFATKRRDRRAALKFLKRAMKRCGCPRSMATDRLRSYGAAMNVIGIVGRQLCKRWLNNRAENSHQPFRRREGAMAKFRDIKTLQKFASAHASIHNHFNHDRHLNRRDKTGPHQIGGGDRRPGGAQAQPGEAIEEALSDKPEPACEGCRSEAFRPPADATRPGRRNGSV